MLLFDMLAYFECCHAVRGRGATMRMIFFILCGAFSAVCCHAGDNGQVNVVLLGDSNTWLGGDSCSGRKGWSKWFCDKFAPASCRSYARSGATWTNTAGTRCDIRAYAEKLDDDNVIYNQINRLVADCRDGRAHAPQLVIIMAGTNDAWFGSARPYAFSETPRDVFTGDGMITETPVGRVVSLARSVRYGCEMLYEAFPSVQIVLVTPMQSAAAGYAAISRVGDVIEECGRRMSISVIRLDHEGCVYGTAEKMSRRNTYDGTHTSVDGARRTGYYLARRVESVLQM